MRFAAALLAPIAIVAAPVAGQESPQAAVNALLAADRAFSAQAATRAPVEGLTAMLDAEVVMPTRNGWMRGRDAVTAYMRGSPNFAGENMQWRPVRGGISADGQHGFTYGYLEVASAPAERVGRRYLAYWIRRPEGWRVAAYKQAFRTPEERMRDAMPPDLPSRMVMPNPAGEAAHLRSIVAAEQAFSDRAQQVGLRAAFTEFGRPDAMNMGGPTGFRIGNQEIGAGFPEERTSPVVWNADRALVASSGDLGVTIGIIRRNGTPPEGQPAEIPFFTIWRRDDPAQPWRYVAE